MTAEDTEKLSREVSELLGWKSVPSSGGDGFVLVQPNGESVTSWSGMIIRCKTETDLWQMHGPKWTSSEDASAKLLEMMPMPSVKKTRLRGVHGKLLQMVGWECWADTIAKYDHHQNPDRKVAIALATRAWLQSLTPEERKKLCLK